MVRNVLGTLEVDGHTYTYGTYKTKTGQERVDVRDSKGLFVSHFKYHDDTQAKFTSAKRTQEKIGKPVKIPGEGRLKSGHDEELIMKMEEEDETGAEYAWYVRYSRNYPSDQSKTDITYQAEGYFKDKPTQTQLLDWTQKSFAGAWFSAKTKHGIPSRLFHELADTSDVISGMEVRKVKIIKSGDNAAQTDSTVHERDVRDKIRGTIVFERKGQKYRYSNW